MPRKIVNRLTGIKSNKRKKRVTCNIGRIEVSLKKGASKRGKRKAGKKKRKPGHPIKPSFAKRQSSKKS